jgi:hypothetical protein
VRAVLPREVYPLSYREQYGMSKVRRKCHTWPYSQLIIGFTRINGTGIQSLAGENVSWLPLDGGDLRQKCEEKVNLGRVKDMKEVV